MAILADGLLCNQLCFALRAISLLNPLVLRAVLSVIDERRTPDASGLHRGIHRRRYCFIVARAAKCLNLAHCSLTCLPAARSAKELAQFSYTSKQASKRANPRH